MKRYFYLIPVVIIFGIGVWLLKDKQVFSGIFFLLWGNNLEHYHRYHKTSGVFKGEDG